MSLPSPSQPRRWRAPILGLLGLTALTSLGLGARLWREARERSQAAISRVPPSQHTVRLRAAPQTPLGQSAPGVGLLTAPGETRDGLVLPTAAGGGTLIASAGGLLAYQAMDAAPRLYSHLDGLSAVSLRALSLLPDGRVVVGDAQGGLTVLQRDRATVYTLASPAAPGPILDLVPAVGRGDLIYVLVQDLGLLAWDLQGDGATAVDVGKSGGADLRGATALCQGEAGVFVGMGDGRVLRRSGEKVVPFGAVPQRVTALACTGTRVYVGTPVGLYASPARGGDTAGNEATDSAGAAALTLLRADLTVTSLLDNGGDQGVPGTGGSLVVGTFDEGVYRFEVSGQRLRQSGHQLTRARVLRLRRADPGSTARAQQREAPFIDAVLALTTRAAYHLTPDAPDPPALAAPEAALSGPHVTALAEDGHGRLWAGTFEHGADLLDLRALPGAATAPVRGHRPQPADAGGDNINALVRDPRRDQVLAATVRGVDRYGPDDLLPQRLGAADGILGDQVQAVALFGDGLAIGTSRGLTLRDAGGQTRSLYAFHGLAANRVYALLAVPPRLYVGTLGGVSVVAEDRVQKSYTPETSAGLGAGWVSALAACGGSVFIGTYGGGVSVLADAAAPTQPTGEGRAPARVTSLPATLHVNPGALLCDEGQLYVGTLEAGLYRLDPQTRAARRLDGRLLPSPSVTAIHAITAPAPLFLIGTEAGLLWLDPRRRDDALRGAAEVL